MDRYGKGPLKIGITEFQYPDLKDYFKAFQGAGAYAARSGDNGDAYGTAWFPNTMNPLTGERSHARNSYYEPISKRSNLKVMLDTLATEIVFDSGKKLTAKGVKITNKTNTTLTVYARKEVILAAGAFNTPKLLQLSGIGPKSVLNAAGIPVKLEHDGVGANFQDHPYTSMAFNVNVSNMSKPNPTVWNNSTFNASAWEQYQANKTGPLRFARGNSLAFIPLQDVDPERYNNFAKQVQNPNNEAFLPSVYKNSKKLLQGFKAQRKVLAELYESGKAGVVEFPITGSGAFQIVGLEKPVSRGTVMIDPANPQGAPKVLYNSFSNPIDKAIIASCVRYIRKVWARPELSKYSLVETSPGAQYTTDEEIIAKAVESGSLSPTLSHPSCSCAMMPEKLGGCVSDKLLFYGVQHLSIVDASIIPLVPSQHLQSIMYAIGEKAADIIKKRS
jgi:choline dehydrogenase-like flavoprotein